MSPDELNKQIADELNKQIEQRFKLTCGDLLAQNCVLQVHLEARDARIKELEAMLDPPKEPAVPKAVKSK